MPERKGKERKEKKRKERSEYNTNSTKRFPPSTTSARTALILRRQGLRTRHRRIIHDLPAPIPHLPIRPHSRLSTRPGRPSHKIEMDAATARILEIVARAAAPMVVRGVTRVDDLDRDRGPGADAVVVDVRAAGGELVALAAGGAAVWLARRVEGAVEELLVHGGVVVARDVGPLPGGLAAVAGGAHPAVVLGRGGC